MEHRLAEGAAESTEAAAPKPSDRVAVADPTGPRWRHPRPGLLRQLPFPCMTP
jgi:hypothetical protein